MELALRRALMGYRRRATLALFQTLEQESLAAREAQDRALREISVQLDDALRTLHETEATIAAEQEQQQVLLALLDELALRGVQVLESAKSALGEQESVLLREIAHRELVLAHRRQILYGLRDDVEAAVRRALREISLEDAGDRLTGGAEPATHAPAERSADEAMRQERAGA